MINIHCFRQDDSVARMFPEFGYVYVSSPVVTAEKMYELVM